MVQEILGSFSTLDTMIDASLIHSFSSYFSSVTLWNGTYHSDLQRLLLLVKTTRRRRRRPAKKNKMKWERKKKKKIIVAWHMVAQDPCLLLAQVTSKRSPFKFQIKRAKIYRFSTKFPQKLWMVKKEGSISNLFFSQKLLFSFPSHFKWRG